MKHDALIPNQVLLHFATPERYTPTILDMFFSTDDSIIISITLNDNIFGYDGDEGIWIWDSQTGRLIGLILFKTFQHNRPYYMPLLEQQGAWLIQAEQKEVFKTAIHPQQHKIACKHRGHISIWEVKQQQYPMRSIEAWKQGSTQIKQSIINTEGFQLSDVIVKPLQSKEHSVQEPSFAIVWRPYSQHLLDINQGIAQLWDTDTNTLIANYIKPNTYVIDGSFNHDGSKLATISSDNTVQIWDLSNTLIIQELQLPHLPKFIEWSMDDKQIFIIHKLDIFPQLWNIIADELITLQSPIVKRAIHYAGDFIHSGRMLALPRSESILELWNVSPPQLQSVFELRDEEVTQFQLEHQHDPNIFNLTGLINWEDITWNILFLRGSHTGCKLVICAQNSAVWICDIPNRGDSACESGSEAAEHAIAGIQGK